MEWLNGLFGVWNRLDVPEWKEYSTALKQCGSDFIQASKSSSKFVFLTLRPIVQLLLIIMQGLWFFLLKNGWISIQKGALQGKAAIKWSYKFHRSLSTQEILGEIAIIALCFAIYHFRKWLKKQTYWSRTTRWLRQKKRMLRKVRTTREICYTLPRIIFLIYYFIFLQSYTEAVHQLAKVSSILAMTTPHLMFVGAGIGFKMVFPSLVKWLANETYATAALSIWYPLLSTLVWIQNRSHAEDVNDVTKATYKPKSRTFRSSKVSGGKNKNQKKSSVPSPPSPESITAYWLRYWEVYGMARAFGSFCLMIPFFGTFVASLTLTAELRLFFFVWLFGMEKLLGNASEDAFLAETMPMKLLDNHLNPILVRFTTAVSEAVPKETWKSIVHSQTKPLLSVVVMLRFLSEKNKEWLLHVLDESRVILLPSITLFMPSFITQFGVAYVQFLVPSVKSARTEGEEAKILFLKYWILHCMFHGLLIWLSSLLWWIPFSTHIVFVAWCNLAFPQTIAKYYGMLESELVAFGLVKGDSQVTVIDTRTARLITAIANRLPSASVDEDEDDDENDLPVDESNLSKEAKADSPDSDDSQAKVKQDQLNDATDEAILVEEEKVESDEDKDDSDFIQIEPKQALDEPSSLSLDEKKNQ